MAGDYRPVVESFIGALDGLDVGGKRLDVRENVRFKGANLSHWVREHYPTTGCTLALEFKKTFMDEWTGEVDRTHLDALTKALNGSIPVVLDSLGKLKR